MNKIIINEQMVHSIKKDYVAKVSIYINSENRYKHYYYRDQLKGKRKSDPVWGVMSYEGSSTKGKGIPKEQLYKDMSESSKDIEYEILVNDHSLSSDGFGFEEAKHIHLHNWPIGGIKSDDCYNEHASGKGTMSSEKMRSFIQYEKLSEMLKKHIEGEKQFEENYITRERIAELIENNKFVQSREKKEGNTQTIARYEENLRVDGEWDWKGYVMRYMPPIGSEEYEEIGDGNQSARAVMRVRKIRRLKTIDIPFEYHNFMMLSDKEWIGTERNAPPKDRADHFSEGDFRRNVRNLVKQYDLLKDGEVDFDHPVFKRRIAKSLNLATSEINPLLSPLKIEFKNEHIKELQYQEGTYDFSSDALKQTKDDTETPIPNGNLTQFLKVRQHIWDSLNGEFDESKRIY